MNVKKRALIIANTWKKEALPLAHKISALLSGKKIDSLIYAYDGTNIEVPLSDADFAITLGGDGTVLFAARFCSTRGIPIFPVNLGEFGFIAGIQPNDWQAPLLDYLDGNTNGNERMMLRTEVFRDSNVVFSSEALNDAVISGSGIARIVQLAVSFDGNSFGSYKADGIIVATPTGSTAYSAASGGPILSPEMSAFILSPICAFSLSNRPIVLPSSGKMNITILPSRQKETILTVDGQVVCLLKEGDVVKVTEAARRVMMIGCDASVFYSALRSKLNWSGTPVPLSVCDECDGVKDA